MYARMFFQMFALSKKNSIFELLQDGINIYARLTWCEHSGLIMIAIALLR